MKTDMVHEKEPERSRWIQGKNPGLYIEMHLSYTLQKSGSDSDPTSATFDDFQILGFGYSQL